MGAPCYAVFWRAFTLIKPRKKKCAYKRNSGLTLVEFLVVLGIFAILASILLPALGRAREASRRAACVNNLKQMSQALRMYAGESKGSLYPPIAAYYDLEVNCDVPSYPAESIADRAVYFWNPEMMYPDYLTDLNVIVCPSDRGWDQDSLRNSFTGEIDIYRKCIGRRGWTSLNGSYNYMGHMYDKIEDEPGTTISVSHFRAITGLECLSAPKGARVSSQLTAALIELADVLPEDQAEFVDSAIDLSYFDDLSDASIGNGNSTDLLRLRVGIARFLTTDANSPAAIGAFETTIPMMWDQMSTLPSPRDYNHAPGGTNVLYLDGHVEFERYPGVGPASVAAAVFSGCLEG